VVVGWSRPPGQHEPPPVAAENVSHPSAGRIGRSIRGGMTSTASDRRARPVPRSIRSRRGHIARRRLKMGGPSREWMIRMLGSASRRWWQSCARSEVAVQCFPIRGAPACGATRRLKDRKEHDRRLQTRRKQPRTRPGSLPIGAENLEERGGHHRVSDPSPWHYRIWSNSVRCDRADLQATTSRIRRPAA